MTESADGLLQNPGGAGVEEFPHADRLRLFSFATAEKRGDYLWVLRAFDMARGAYVVLLHASDVVETLNRCPGGRS